jgi:hypothetical protein
MHGHECSLDVIVYIDIIDQDALYIYNPRMQDTMKVHVKQKISKIDTNENKCNHSNNIFLMELFVYDINIYNNIQ